MMSWVAQPGRYTICFTSCMTANPPSIPVVNSRSKEAITQGKPLWYLYKSFTYNADWSQKWRIRKVALTNPKEHLGNQVYYDNFWHAYAEAESRNQAVLAGLNP